MLFFGYLLSILMGVVLGTMGAGGSILIMPILVYFIGVNPSLATTYSLIIVGFTALVGCISYLKNNKINLLVSFIFALPSLITIYFTRRYFIHLLPENFYFHQLMFSKDFFIMIIFALLLAIASFLMLYATQNKSRKYINNISNNLKIVFHGSLVGFITGIIGVGGGFLIIPTLVVFLGLDIKSAIGTSLFIIFIKSLIGFLGDVQAGVTININIIFIITFCTSFGILIGTFYVKNISSNNLKKAFGYLLAIISIIIIIYEISKSNIL